MRRPRNDIKICDFTNKTLNSIVSFLARELFSRLVLQKYKMNIRFPGRSPDNSSFKIKNRYKYRLSTKNTFYI